MIFRGGETVTVLRGTEQLDPYSGEVSNDLDWTAPEETDYADCAVGPNTTQEPIENGRVPVVVGLIVFGPYNMDVTARDRLRIRGEDYTIEGEPGFWRSPFSGWEPGVQIMAKKVSG